MPKYLSTNGLKLIKFFEGLRLDAYLDVAGSWTIGYGSTYNHDGTAIKRNDVLANEAQASALLLGTISQYEDAINKHVTSPITQNQFDALVSFAYNEGVGAFVRSTLLKRLNEKDYQSAATQFLLWNKITDPKNGNKIISHALANRRKVESSLFLNEHLE